MTNSDSAPLLTAAELAEHLFQDIAKLIPSNHPIGELLEKYHIASYADPRGWRFTLVGAS